MIDDVSVSEVMSRWTSDGEVAIPGVRILQLKGAFTPVTLYITLYHEYIQYHIKDI